MHKFSVIITSLRSHNFPPFSTIFKSKYLHATMSQPKIVVKYQNENKIYRRISDPYFADWMWLLGLWKFYFIWDFVLWQMCIAPSPPPPNESKPSHLSMAYQNVPFDLSYRVCFWNNWTVYWRYDISGITMSRCLFNIFYTRLALIVKSHRNHFWSMTKINMRCFYTYIN